MTDDPFWLETILGKNVFGGTPYNIAEIIAKWIKGGNVKKADAAMELILNNNGKLWDTSYAKVIGTIIENELLIDGQPTECDEEIQAIVKKWIDNIRSKSEKARAMTYYVKIC